MGKTLTWTGGRQLTSVGNDISYAYSADGMRQSKTVNGVTTTFALDGAKILEQSDGTDTLHFRYDSYGNLVGFTYGDADYFYIRNLQNDITAILDGAGNVIVEYAYDVGGTVLSITGSAAATVGELNPFRYRSYYYDSETGWYYLQSRYYDPVTSRYLNADKPELLPLLLSIENPIATNFFAYCANNPIMYCDPDGHIFKYTLKNGKYTVSGTFNKSPTWSTSTWKSRKEYANCYAYALNISGNVKNNKLQPGELSGKLWNKYSGTTGEKIVAAFRADLKKMSKDLKYKTDKYLYAWDNRYFGPINGSGYDVALVYGYNKNGYFDYHWYRKDSNGKWSHKRGLSTITNVDASGKAISDPKTANRNYQSSGGHNYSTFVGTYRIYRHSVW